MHVLAAEVRHIIKIMSWVLIVDSTDRDEELPLDAWDELDGVLEH